MLNRTILSAAAVFIVADLFLIFLWAPIEQVMGPIQKVFYIHVPAIWVGFLALFIVLLSSIMYLIRRDKKWDHRASSAAEIGVVFITIGIITGAIWGKPVWGTWWTWDPKLTTTFILWVIYIAYLVVRSYAPNRDQAARWGAVIGVIGAFDIPIVYMAANWWRTLHPELVTGALAEGGGLEARMEITFYFSVIAFTLLFISIIRLRVTQKHQEEQIEIFRREIA
jgi:heme exporter protein C